MIKKTAWFLVALIGAFSLAKVTNILFPQEKINAIWILTAALCCYALAYRFYAAFLATKVFVLNDKHDTPATRYEDGKNFHSTNKWVLFGHHFAAIAGAGPLIGPILAAQFGYLPGFLWILIGSVLAGGVHDLVILIASMRRDGKSLARIAKEEIGLLSGVAALISILFVLVVAIAGLGLAVINSLYHNPWGTFIIASTIPIALGMGLFMKKNHSNNIAKISIIGGLLLLAVVIFGKNLIQTPLAIYFDFDKTSITWLLIAYGFLASVLPVWLLLTPRDYLSSFMKIGVIGLLMMGVFAVAPEIQMPAFTAFCKGGGPIIPGALFPFLFITIACGAISGFHALIGSGTTSKMIEKESQAKMIGYGAMLMEGFVSLMALIAATVLIPGDYFAINTKLSFATLAHMGFPVAHVTELSQLIGVDIVGRPGGAVSLAVGMAYIFSSIPFLKHLMAYWYQFALMFEALFILTTIDAGTRVARYIIQELGGHIYAPFGNLNNILSILSASLIVVSGWGYFIFTGSVATIWPMFGTVNQLLAMLALCIGTSLLLKKGRVRYVWITLIPMVFMAAVTFTAAFELIINFINKAQTAAFPLIYYLNIFLMAGLVFLAIVILIDSILKWNHFFKIGKKNK